MHAMVCVRFGVGGPFGMAEAMTNRALKLVPENRKPHPRSEALLQIGSRLGRLGAWVFELAESSLTWSDEIRAIHEVAPDYEATTESGLAFYPAEYREMVTRAFRKCIGTGEPFDLEVEIITARGRRIWVRIIGEAERDRRGNIRRIIGAFQDISGPRKAADLNRQESEQRFRTLTEAMPQIVWMTTPEGSNVYTNQQWVEYTGLTVEESRGAGWMKPFHPEDKERMSQTWATAYAAGSLFETECRLQGADGSYRWWLIRGLPVAADGVVTQWIGTCTNVDDLKQAVDRVAEQAALIDEVPDAIVVSDLQNRLVSWSRGAERMYGWTAAEVLGRPLPQILETHSAGVVRSFESVLKDGEWSGELERTTRSGEVLTVDSRSTLLRGQEGQPRGVLTVEADISTRKRAELQLNESEERYRLLFDRNPHPTWVYDVETLKFLAVNEAAIMHYGYSRDEFLSMTIKDIRPPEEVAELLRIVEVKRDTTTPQIFGVFKHLKKDGSVIEAEIASCEIDYSGREASLIIAVDVSERRRIEQQFLRAQRMESIGTLASGIAHDLNNILMPVMMGTALLKRDNPSKEGLRAIENMQRSASRGKDLVQQVLSFARGVEGSRVPVHMRDIVREVRSIVKSTFPKNIELHVDVAPDLWWVDGDPTQLNQVLLNLCVNARDAMPNGGLLTISAKNETIDEQYASMHRDVAAGPHVMIEVEDDGVGIAPHVVDRIFEPFYTTKDLGNGTGLGLSTVAAIVRSHKGLATVHSEVGQGSKFRVHLPARPASAKRDVDRAVAVTDSPRGDGELILVADDEQSILSITRQTLETFGYRVITADNGVQALALFSARRSEIQAVITDMMMPVMDGPALIAALRQIDPHVRVVASSGLLRTATPARADSAQTSPFLQKPFSAETLLTTLQNLLGKA